MCFKIQHTHNTLTIMKFRKSLQRVLFFMSVSNLSLRMDCDCMRVDVHNVLSCVAFYIVSAIQSIWKMPTFVV